MMQRKNKLYHSYKINPNDDTRESYRTCRNQLNNALRKVKFLFYASELSHCHDKCSHWKAVQHFIQPKRKRPEIDGIRCELQLLEDRRDTANAFNDYFVSVGPNLAKTMSQKQPPELPMLMH